MRRTHPCAFTIIELLIVIAIIGLLATLMVPAVQMAREASRRAHCANNMHQIGAALANYEGARKFFPPGRLGCENSSAPGCPDHSEDTNKANLQRSGASGFALLLPYIEESNLIGTDFDFRGLFNVNLLGAMQDPVNIRIMNTSVPTYICPTSTAELIFTDPKQSFKKSFYVENFTAATGSYAFCMGTFGPCRALPKPQYDGKYAGPSSLYKNNGLFVYRDGHQTKHVLDGLSKTFAVGEVTDADNYHGLNLWARGQFCESSMRSTCNLLNKPLGQGDHWINPGNRGKMSAAFGSEHPNGANFLFADGHVVFISNAIEAETYSALATIAGGEKLGSL